MRFSSLVLTDVLCPSLRTDNQLRFSLHFKPLGISFCLLVSQPVAFPSLETIILGHY